jgi:mycothiol synthase
MTEHHFGQLLREGFTIRPGSISDVQAATDLINAWSMDRLGVEETTPRVVHEDWTSPNFDIDQSTRVVVAPEGELIGLVEVWDLQDLPVHPFLWWRVHPAWQDDRVETSMLSWAIDRARQAIPRTPPGARVAAYAEIPSMDGRGKNVLDHLGFNLLRHGFRMVIDLDTPPPAPLWPERISLRNYNHPQDVERMYRAEEDAFRDHFGYVPEPFETGFERWLHHATKGRNFDPALWFMAMDDGKIAGIIRGRPFLNEDRTMGWISSLGVRRPWRQRGLGLALLRHLFAVFHKRGKARAGLAVDASSLTGATRLYRKAGMHVQRRYDLYEIPLREGDEVATMELHDGE